jgi:hypothetical protein
MLLFRFKLSNEIEGDHYIDEPVGWDTSKFLLKRDPKTHSIPFEYSTQLKFYRANLHKDGGAEYILNAEKSQGVDAVIKLYIDIAADEEDYINEYLGKLNLDDLNETEEYLECFIEQQEFFTTFNQRYDLPVSFKDSNSVDGQALQVYTPYTLNLHSKQLVKRTRAEIGSDGNSISTNSALFEFNITGSGLLPPLVSYEDEYGIAYVQFTFPEVQQNELEGYNKVGGAVLTSIPPPIIEIKEAGSHDIDVYLKFSLYTLATQSSSLGPPDVKCAFDNGHASQIERIEVTIYIEIDGVLTEIGNVVTPDLCHASYTDYTFNTIEASFSQLNIDLEVGDEVKLYASVEVSGTYRRPEIGPMRITFDFTATLLEGSYLRVTGRTTTAASTAPALRIHDVFQNICNKITGQNDSFYSEYFGYVGAPYHTYSAKGCGADYALLTGHNIRNYPVADRPFQGSFKELFESCDAMFNLGLGVETIGGIQKIRVEPKSYFYTKTAIDGIYMDFPAKIQRTIEKDLFVNMIEVGYNQWQPEEINGLDEFNSVRQYSLALKTIGEKLEIKSSIIASGSIIEVTRRKQFDATLTTDTKYDNNIFIIALNKSNPTICEKNENFAQVNNLLSPETAYNIRLSPVRNMLRHGNRINSSLLKKVGTDYKFSYGEGNFIMESEFTADNCPGSYNNELLAENDNIPWAYASLSEVDPLWTLNAYTFKYPLSFFQFKSIRDNKNKALLFTDVDGVDKLGFIVELEYDINRGMGSFKLREANEIPYNYTRNLAHLLLQDGNDFLLEDSEANGYLIL